MGYLVKFEYQEAYVELSVWDDEKTATVTVLYSKFRGLGAGRVVLERAIEYSDIMGFTLVLEVVPFGEGIKMSATDLKAFYMSLGFESVGSNVLKRRAIEGDN